MTQITVKKEKTAIRLKKTATVFLKENMGI